MSTKSCPRHLFVLYSIDNIRNKGQSTLLRTQLQFFALLYLILLKHSITTTIFYLMDHCFVCCWKGWLLKKDSLTVSTLTLLAPSFNRSNIATLNCFPCCLHCIIPYIGPLILIDKLSQSLTRLLAILSASYSLLYSHYRYIRSKAFTLLYHIIYYIILFILYHIIHILLHYIIFYHIILYYIILYHIIFYYILLYNII